MKISFLIQGAVSLTKLLIPISSHGSLKQGRLSSIPLLLKKNLNNMASIIFYSVLFFKFILFHFIQFNYILL